MKIALPETEQQKIKRLETEIEQLTVSIRNLLAKFANKRGETLQILQGVNLSASEAITLIDSSISILQDELARMHKTAKKTAKQLDSLSQGILL